LIQYLAHEKGIAVLVSSHILQEMQMMCDRVGIIQNGVLLQVSTVDELTHQNTTHYRYTVQPMEHAVALLRQHLPNQIVTVTDTFVDLAIADTDVPVVTQKLMENGIQIYGVQPTGNLLEDSFIEITGGGNTVV